MDQLNAAQDHAGTGSRFEAEHQSRAAFDGAVILLNPIIEILTLPDLDRFQRPPRSVLQPALGITRQDGFAIGLAAVDDDPLGTAMPCERLAQKPLGRSQIAPLTEPELALKPLPLLINEGDESNWSVANVSGNLCEIVEGSLGFGIENLKAPKS